MSPALAKAIARQATWQRSKPLVFEVSLAFQRFGVLVFAEDILVNLHVRAAKAFEPRFDPLLILYNFFG
jgi:hypothetical protein